MFSEAYWKYLFLYINPNAHSLYSEWSPNKDTQWCESIQKATWAKQSTPMKNINQQTGCNKFDLSFVVNGS